MKQNNIGALANDAKKKKQLRYITWLFIAIVAVALLVLVQYTFSQLQWEQFHQNRLQAEALSLRLDKNLQDIIDEEEQRASDDYRFLSLANPVGNIGNNAVFQRSSLSQLPLQSKVPGIIGYFQLDANNQFSTPLLPQVRTQAAQYGLSNEDYLARVDIAKQLAAILLDNKLSLKNSTASAEEIAAPYPRTNSSSAPSSNNGGSNNSSNNREPNPQQTNGAVIAKAEAELKKTDSISFEKLKDKAQFTPSNKLGRVDDLLEDSQNNEFDQRSRLAQEKKSKLVQSKKQASASLKKQAPPTRQLRKEQRITKESFASAPSLNSISSETLNEADSVLGSALNTEIGEALSIQIFESEVEPFQVNVLESGHILIFRRVWTQSQRFIQGMLVDKARFIEAIIEKDFINSALSENTRLAMAYQGNILAAYGEIAKNTYGYLDSARQLSGTVLYQKSLLSPFDDFNVVLTIGELSSGASGQVVLISAFILLFTVLLGAWLFNRYAHAQQNLMNQQQDFISSVSHELKTPLTSIRMYGEMLKEGWVSEAKKNEYYHFIFDESERLSRLINNVLQLAKLNRNTLEPKLKSCSVDTLISIAESKLSGHALAAGFDLTINKHVSEENKQQDASVNIDEDLFIQIMINLVDNSLKYSVNAEVKKIELLFSNNKEDLSISVRDYGPGIEPEKLKKVFDLFYRNENELTREAKGTGIGLALVAQYVQLMEGKVYAVNKQPGLEVLVTFPYTIAK